MPQGADHGFVVEGVEGVEGFGGAGGAGGVGSAGEVRYVQYAQHAVAVRDGLGRAPHGVDGDRLRPGLAESGDEREVDVLGEEFAVRPAQRAAGRGGGVHGEALVLRAEARGGAGGTDEDGRTRGQVLRRAAEGAQHRGDGGGGGRDRFAAAYLPA
ncbi:hypothetical protein LUW77_18060 [Streptomyces radiopugnans]|nr:hypothetical protein LUW77_18060 [Streptomyces radiopugnans]